MTKAPEQTPEAGRAPLLPGVRPVLDILRDAPERVDAVFLRKGRHSKDMGEVVDLCRAAGVRFSLLDPAAFARVWRGAHKAGNETVVARLFEAGFSSLEDMLASVMDAPLPLILALDQVQDPGNAGTLARTVYALGGAGILVPRHNGVFLGAAAAKAAAGALDRLPVAKVANLGQALDAAEKEGLMIYGASALPPQDDAHARQRREAAGEDRAEPAGKKERKKREPGLETPVPLNALTAVLRLPAVLVLGGEESGLRPGIERRCRALLGIPMLRDFDSLNVAQAGGILLSCFVRGL